MIYIGDGCTAVFYKVVVFEGVTHALLLPVLAV